MRRIHMDGCVAEVTSGIRLLCGLALTVYIVVILAGTLYAEENVTLELGGYKLGTYYQDNEELTEAGPIILKRRVFKCDRVYVEYDVHSRLRRCCFATPILKEFHHVNDYDREIRMMANELHKRYPFLVKEMESERSIAFSCNAKRTKVSIYESQSSIFLDVGDSLTQVPLPPVRKPTTPITNLFGVVLGSPISSLEFQTKRLKKEILGCQYSFTPPKRFRAFDNYYLKVYDGAVVGIYGVYYPSKEVDQLSFKKEKESIVGLLKEKFKVRFVMNNRGRIPYSAVAAAVWSWSDSQNRNADETWYRGLGNDFTHLFLKDGYTRIRCSDKQYLCLGLETDFDRKCNYERLNQLKQSSDKSRQADLDAL